MLQLYVCLGSIFCFVSSHNAAIMFWLGLGEKKPTWLGLGEHPD